MDRVFKLEVFMVKRDRNSNGMGLFLMLLTVGTGWAAGAQAQTRTALDDYVAKPDSVYAWKVANTIEKPGFTGYVLELTSQTWRTAADVDRPVWKHWLTVVKPNRVRSNKSLLFIGGGSNKGGAPKKVDPMLVKLAMGTKSVVSEVKMVPNQPLTFVCTDNKERYEDDLVAYTWAKYVKTGDATWLARFPMVKSAVRAMDSVQAFLKGDEGGRVRIDGFVVAGGSKRGWTTWLTGAVDKRVVAIVPIVIDVLNVTVSMTHHYEAYGFWAPAVGDYVSHRIMDRMNSPEFEALRKIVDPYEYRDRLTMPKYILNSSGDQFFLPDSSQFYFDDLVGEKYLRYVPNSDHSLGGTDAVESLGAFYLSILTGAKRPAFSWTVEKDGSIHVKTVDKPERVRLWQASNPEGRDFRLVKIGKAWKNSELRDQGDGSYIGRVGKPARGWTAFFVELTYGSGGRFPYKFTTQVSVVPDVLPHEGELTGKGGK